MNEHLAERFGRSRRGARDEGDTAHVWILPPKLNPLVHQYFEPARIKVGGGSWLERPEIPTSEEVMDLDDTSSSGSTDIVELLPNRPKGAWESKEEYLSTHYELYREDAIRGIREAVTNIRITPEAVEDAFHGRIGIYEKVKFHMQSHTIACANADRFIFVDLSHPPVASPSMSPLALAVLASRFCGSNLTVLLLAVLLFSRLSTTNSARKRSSPPSQHVRSKTSD